MKPLPLLLAVLLLADAGAQTSTPPVAPGAATPRSKQSPPAKPAATKAKGPLPDPDLLDGSKYEPEKRPLYGMLSEIEMGEEQGDQQDRVSPNSGPQAQTAGQENKPGGAQQQQGAAAQPQQAGAGGSAEKPGQGPQAQAEGSQAKSISGPAGAQNPAGGPQGARNMQIGDATLQIQTVPQTPDMVGAQQASSSQQYEKQVPAGQQSNNRNQGVEKGKLPV